MGFSFAASPDILVDLVSAGSACGVWEDGLSTYVLSAAHVFERAGPEPRVQWLDDSFTVGSGSLLAEHLWVDGGDGELDAGIVRIDDAGPFGLGGDYPHGDEILEWEAITADLVVEICGKHGIRVGSSAQKLPAGRDFEGHPHTRLLLFRLLDGVTLPGDSGAAVVSMPEGMLIGHHISLHRDARGVAFSVVVPAADVRDIFRDRLGNFQPRP